MESESSYEASEPSEASEKSESKGPSNLHELVQMELTTKYEEILDELSKIARQQPKKKFEFDFMS